MKIIKSEFIHTNYPVDKKYIHWSRIYEWKYVIDFLTKNKNIKSIHNTACGGLNKGDCLHLTFAKDIDNLCPNSTHSDLWGGGYVGTDVKPLGDNFIFYDITKKFDKKFDLVLNISTLEHLKKDVIKKSIYNLIEQVKENGHLILTFDYPVVDQNLIESIFDTKITKPSNIVTGKGLNIILIHAQK